MLVSQRNRHIDADIPLYMQNFDAPHSQETNFGDEVVLEFTRMWKRVDWERLRLMQFIRFQKAANGTYFAAIEPGKMPDR